MTGEIGSGVRRFREALARGEEPDAGVIAREHPGEALAIAEEVLRAEALYWARAREEMRLARAEVMREAGEDVTFGTVFRNAREDRGVSISALAAVARERGADLAPTTIERLEANQIAVTDVDPEVLAALIDNLQIGRHEFVASVWMALLEMQTHHSFTSTGRRASTLEPDAADYLDRVRNALGIPTDSTHDDVATAPSPTRTEVAAASSARDTEDALDVQAHVDRVFDAAPEERVGAIRRLFVEVLDFNSEQGEVSLAAAPANIELPAAADRIAGLEGVHVLYVALDAPENGRVRTAEVTEAAQLIADQLGVDLLLVFANAGASELHLVFPDLTGTRTVLRRLVFEHGEHNRTPVEQVSKIYRSSRDTRSVRVALAEAFDVEPVTKRFFQEYKRVFEQVEQSVTGVAEGEDRRLFVQTLFNRLMFVYFLQRKGWLNFRGDKNYLWALWSDYRRGRRETDNFYVGRLRALFFAGLNKPGSRDVTAGTDPLIGKVPFLNGGLFEEGVLDKRSGVTVSDEAIGALLTDLFDRFNFTVMESTPFDIEVAVDPEMLGKVFEELVTGRHGSGSYYTPRLVVSFMCREALKGYLEARGTGLMSETIAEFVDEHRTEAIDIAAARRVAAALSEVTVVDPACGSGAYLLGMMQELVELQTALYNAGVDEKKLYELKLEVIQRNLYGVDIDEFAVNIAMLRMWLSLAIEYEGDTPEPLPNLDFRVVCGDSLLGPDPSPENYGDLFRLRAHSVAVELAALKERYMSATTEKDEIKGAVEQLEDDLREALADAAAPLGAVDWRVAFAEVFDREGFDIVIGNPPYVESRSSSISASLKEAYRAQTQRDWGSSLPRGSDLLMFFFPRAAKLMRPGGRGLFITQNSWLNTDYGQKFQRFSIGRFSFSRIIDSASRFFASSNGPNINAVIGLFSRDSVESIEYAIANSTMGVRTIKAVPADSSLKWGSLFAMPESLELSLAKLQAKPQVTMDTRFGQGLNFPKREFNSPDSQTAIIVGHGGFVAAAADGTGPPVSASRANRIPALIMPRGIGDRYYCTFNACRAFSWSAVELYLPDVLWDSDTHYSLWAYLNSSLAWLFREVTGRKNLGGGMLKAEATDMKMLPVAFDYDFAAEAKSVFEMLRHREALSVWDEVDTREHRMLDEMVSGFFGISGEMDNVRRDLVQQVRFRAARSRR